MFSDTSVDNANIQNDEEMWTDEIESNDVEIKTGCIFCTRQIRRRNGVNQKVTKATSQSRKDRIFEILCSFNQQDKVNDFKNANSVNYHLSCLAENEHKISMANKPAMKKSDHQKIRSEALSKVMESVKSTLIEKHDVRMLVDIYQYYVAFFQEQRSEMYSFEPVVLQSQYLLQKILQTFPILTKTVIKNRTYLHRRDLPLEEMCANGFQLEDSIARIKKVAFEIRKIVKEMKKRELPKKNLSLKDITEGECDVPRELYVLIECLLKGPRAMENPKKDKKILSICNSIIFTMSNGAIKPASCITLGLSTKSITGSRKMINILNRMGFSISYTLAEEIETELAYGCSSQQHILPYGLIAQRPNLRTHLAFDNFDKYVETKSGKDTLHDTVGIVFQNVDIEGSSVANEACDRMATNNNDEHFQRRRKYFSPFDSTIEAYSKGNRKTTSKMFGKDPVFPDVLQKAVDLNNMWMFNYAFHIGGNKRWFAWNSDRIVDKNPIQKIGYLPNINMSPTSDAAVQKTLQIAQQIASECNQPYIIVTYDLAIASKAYKIQASMSPQFDNIFITLGAFHTQMSFFKVSTLSI